MRKWVFFGVPALLLITKLPMKKNIFPVFISRENHMNGRRTHVMHNRYSRHDFGTSWHKWQCVILRERERCQILAPWGHCNQNKFIISNFWAIHYENVKHELKLTTFKILYIYTLILIIYNMRTCIKYLEMLGASYSEILNQILKCPYYLLRIAFCIRIMPETAKFRL